MEYHPAPPRAQARPAGSSLNRRLDARLRLRHVLPDASRETTMHEPASHGDPYSVPSATRASRLHHWRAAARELVIIVAGVLGALAGQAWWETRRDRIREHEYLQQLLADTRENERRVDVAIGADKLARNDLRRLANELYVATPPQNRDSALALFTGSAFSTSNFTPVTGTYGALVSSGDLRLVRTDSLRAAIVEYGATLDYEQRMLGFFLQQAFGQPAPLAHSLPFMQAMFAAPDSIPALFRRSDFHLAQLRGDREFGGFLFALQVANNNRLVHLGLIRDATERLRAMLEAEAHERGGRGDSASIAHSD
jgi:hypothetical protein